MGGKSWILGRRSIRHSVAAIGISIGVCSEIWGSAPGGFRKDWPNELKVGMVATYGVKESEARSQPLIHHLEQKLGLKINCRVSNDFNWFLVSFAKKELDFALMGPSNYVDAHKLFGVEAVAMELSEDGKPGYYSVIVTSASSGINSIDQGRGRVLAFTDQNSTSGFIIPTIYFIKEKKQTPARFASRVVFTGTPQDLVQGVLSQKYDLGATNDWTLARLSESLKFRPDQLRVLWKSELIPGAPWVTRKDLPVSLQFAFREALLEFNENKSALKKMQSGGFRSARDGDYDVIREWHKFLPR